MKGAIFLIVIVLLAAGIYGYHKNPEASQKLGLDLVNNLKAVYTTTPDATPAPTTINAPPPGTPIVPVATPTPSAPSTAGVVPVLPSVTPAPAAAPVTPVAAAAPPAASNSEIPEAMRAYDTEDYGLAVRAARQKNKRLFLFFTGSDYCTPCKMTVLNVFPTARFQTWVSSQYIMVTLDFPHDKSKQSPELIAQNSALHEKYHINGVPTFIITEVDGTEIKRCVGAWPTADQLIADLDGPPAANSAPAAGSLIPPDTHL